MQNTHNKILTALTLPAHGLWMPQLEIINLEVNQIIYPNAENIDYVYFPVSSVVSMRCELEEGTSIEFSQIGNEGIVGALLFASGKNKQGTTSVISSGSAYRIRSGILLREFQNSGSFRMIILKYMEAMMLNAAQISACTRFHSIEQQLSRVLLIHLDRIGCCNISLTHDLIASLLGVRRESITIAAKRLKNLGVIDYNRGTMTIINRSELYNHSCECYGEIKSAYDRVV